MGRPERAVPDGPLQEFAQGLRDLRASAGAPTYRALERRAGFSASALSAAAGGQRLPTLEVTLAYVGACGGDMTRWEARWHTTAAATEPEPEPSSGTDPEAEAAATEADTRAKTAADSASAAAPAAKTATAAAATAPAAPTPPGAAPLAASDPATIGPFTLEARLGSGAMGQVYLARTPAGRAIAVKVIHPALAGDPGFRRRFARELDAVRQVQGLFTASLVDADAHAEQPWLAVEHIPGPTLAQRVEGDGPLPAGEVRALGAGIAEALAAIHAAGLVHRDLKPSNVILAEGGPRVIDFGIAYSPDASGLSTTGTLLGSVPFMAPELAHGEPPSPAADVFALGCLLAYALTARYPFGDGSAAAMLYRIVNGEPDLDLPDGVDADLRELLDACLGKDAAERPATGEIVARLRPGLARDWTPPTPLSLPTVSTARPLHTRVRPRRGPLVAAVLLTVALVAGAAILASRGAPATRLTIQTPDITSTTTGTPAGSRPAAGPAGQLATSATSGPAGTGTDTGTARAGQALAGATSPAVVGRSSATTGAAQTTTAAGPVAPGTWAATVGPSCGTMTRTTSYWYVIGGSDTVGCGDGFWHKRSGDGATADWIFAPGAGRTCSFAVYVADSSTITSKATEYELYDGTGHSDQLTHTYLNQAANLGGQVTWAPATATATGTYDLELIDKYSNGTDEYAGSVAATCT